MYTLNNALKKTSNFIVSNWRLSLRFGRPSSTLNGAMTSIDRRHPTLPEYGTMHLGSHSNAKALLCKLYAYQPSVKQSVVYTIHDGYGVTFTFKVRTATPAYMYFGPNIQTGDCLRNLLTSGITLLADRMNSPLISASLVRQSPALSPITHGISSSPPSSLSPLASSLTRSVFHSELKTWLLANPFLHRPFPLLPDWLHGLSDHLTILLCSTAVLVSVLD